MGPRSLISTEANSDSIQFLPLQPCPDISFFIERGKIEKFVFRLNCLYIQHLKYILFCCTLVSKCIKVDFTETWVNLFAFVILPPNHLEQYFCSAQKEHRLLLHTAPFTCDLYTAHKCVILWASHVHKQYNADVTILTVLLPRVLVCTGQSSLWLVLILGLEAADHLLQPLFI